MQRININTEAIIIRRTNYKDTDKILTIYSPHTGKIDVLAKGIRKMESKKRSHLELFSETKVQLVKSRKFFIISQAEQITSNSGIKANYEKTQIGYIILEIFNKMATEGEPNLNYYNFLKTTIDKLSTAREKQQYLILLLAFESKIIKLFGYMPQVISQNKDTQHLINWLLKSQYDEILENFGSANNTLMKQTYQTLLFEIEEITETELKTTRQFNPF